mgnify:CR=1 FL=1
MLPNLSGLKVSRTAPLEPRVVQIGVYADSPPESAQLGMTVRDASTRVFDAIGPCLGVQMRAEMSAFAGRTYVLTDEDREKVKEFREALFLFWPIDPVIPRSVYSLLQTAVYRLASYENSMREALYELHIFYIRYVWNFKLPESDAPLDLDVQKTVWGYLRGVFNCVSWYYTINNPYHNQLGDGTFFTKRGTPWVTFPKWRDVGVVYDMLIAYWSAQARLKWSKTHRKVSLIDQMNKAWIELYTEVYYRPENGGSKRARDEFYEATANLENPRNK